MKNPLEALLIQAAQLMERLRTHQGSISANLTPEVMAELQRLEKNMAAMYELNVRTFEEAHIDLDELKSKTIHSPEIPLEDKELFLRGREIEREARRLQADYAKAIQAAQTEKEPAKSSHQKKMKDRRNRFKPLGGDKNWIPL